MRFRRSAPIVRVFALVLNTGVVGCVSLPPAARTPDHWRKTDYQWPSDEPSLRESDAHPPTSISSSRGRAFPEVRTTTETPPGNSTRPPAVRISPPKPSRALFLKGDECLDKLQQRAVSFSKLAKLKGVDNPVEIHGKLGGVEFWANDGRPLHMDCRLAVALDRLRPVFSAHGLVRIRYSGAYSYRRTKSGRLSHHALGLAIDLHDFRLIDAEFSVKAHFKTQVGCRKNNPSVNQLACAMRDAALFEEFLTPDFDRDHRDHLHLSVPRQ